MKINVLCRVIYLSRRVHCSISCALNATRKDAKRDSKVFSVRTALLRHDADHDRPSWGLSIVSDFLCYLHSHLLKEDGMSEALTTRYVSWSDWEFVGFDANRPSHLRSESTISSAAKSERSRDMIFDSPGITPSQKSDTIRLVLQSLSSWLSQSAASASKDLMYSHVPCFVVSDSNVDWKWSMVEANHHSQSFSHVSTTFQRSFACGKRRLCLVPFCPHVTNQWASFQVTRTSGL
jgi:hypothetical protein